MSLASSTHRPARAAAAAVVAASLALAGCGAAGGAPDEFRSWAPTNDGCDQTALNSVNWMAEIVPGPANAWVRQEALVRFSSCKASLALVGGTTVKGQVVDTEGRAPVAARLVFSRASMIAGRPDVLTQARTSTDGSFTATLPLGAQSVRVLPDGDVAEQAWPPLSTTVMVQPGMPGTPGADALQIRLRKGMELKGQVLVPFAKNLSAVRVRLVDASTGELLSSVAATDGAGAFDLWASPTVGNRQSKVRLVADGGPLTVSLVRDVDVMAPLELMPIVLQAPALPDPQPFLLPLSGRSTSGVTVPIQGARVDFRCDIAGGPLPNSTNATFAASAVTDDEGRAKVALVPGDTTNRGYAVTVTPPADSLFARTATVVSVGAQGGVLGTLSLDTRPTVTGTIVAATGVPARGVVVAPNPTTIAECDSAGDTTVSVAGGVTGNDGQFLVRVERGAWNLELAPTATSALPRWSIEGQCLHGDATLGTITLPPGNTTSLKLAGPRGEAASGATVRLYAVGPAPGCIENSCPRIARLRADGVTSDSGLLRLVLAVE